MTPETNLRIVCSCLGIAAVVLLVVTFDRMNLGGHARLCAFNLAWAVAMLIWAFLVWPRRR